MNEPLSLIVCAHNEEKNLPFLLATLKPEKEDEIIIVLDRCTDLSEKITDSFSFQLPIRKIKITETGWPESPKKWAVFQGISQAANPNLVFTDADCLLPDSFFNSYRLKFKDADVIAGYSLPVRKTEPGILIELQWMDALFTAVKYSFFSDLNLPYMTVGRNWGFKKRLFRKEFLESHAEIKSGDDDLLFQQLLTTHPAVKLLKLNVETTGTKTNWSDLINQKARHYKAGTKYPIGILISLAVYDLWIPTSLALLIVSLITHSISGLCISLTLLLTGLLFITFNSQRLLSELGVFVSSITRLSLFALPYHFLLPFFSVFLQFLKPKWKN